MEEALTIFIFNHGRFGEELIKSAELIVGKTERLQAFSLLSGMSIEEYCDMVKPVLSACRGRRLVLCDLYGGTPCNVAMMLSMEIEMEIICGVNLPMLIDAIISRNAGKGMRQLLGDITKSGKDAVYRPHRVAGTENDY